MDFPIKVLIIVMLAMVAFFIIVAMMGGWGTQTSSMWEAIVRFFNALFGGGTPTPPA